MEVFVKSQDRYYDMRETRCMFCAVPVRPQELTFGEAIPVRIGGDSANGYEPYHVACERAARIAEVDVGRRIEVVSGHFPSVTGSCEPYITVEV